MSSEFERMLADPYEQFDPRGELLTSIQEYANAPKLAVGSEAPRQRGWWICPNDPPCPHPGVVHDIDEPGGREQCCMEGCDCGKRDGPPVAALEDQPSSGEG